MHPQAKELYQILIASLVFLTVFMALFIRSILRQMRQKLDEYRKQLTREIELIDRERARISADLHDELGTGLSAIGILLRQLAGRFDKHTLQKAGNQVLIQEQKIKEIAYNLVPGVLQTHGLLMALEELFADTAQLRGIQVQQKLCLDDRKYHASKSIHLYRIFREITTNTLKHTKASLINVDGSEDGRFIRISYADNGNGFHADRLSRSKGSGLQHIESRIRLLDAKMEIVSPNGSGTCYLFIIPIQSMLEPHENNP